MHFIKGFMTMTELRVAYFRIGFEDEYDEFLSLMNSFPALKSLELRLVRRLPAYHQVSVFRALTPAPRLKTLQFEGCMLFEGLANVGELRLVTEMMLRSVSSTLETLIPKAYYFGNIALGDVDYVAFIVDLSGMSNLRRLEFDFQPSEDPSPRYPSSVINVLNRVSSFNDSAHLEVLSIPFLPQLSKTTDFPKLDAVILRRLVFQPSSNVNSLATLLSRT
ncbi:hypothetical protein Moror_8653 [Moniliophthora roreri MCA 2997]|uniref:F-box domain-containing protein n=1 Tax=Moniliophthora roreri (strain MCA 2997) TaxID=1381753 RepID=V2X745_MONRO|nr:hypothetical protein Moror_8653 [Moniliophthora roreri MCA 2997]